MAMVKKAVALGKLLPPDDSRDELRAYNKLAGELTQQTRQWRQAMEKQEREKLERKSSRRQPPRSDSPGRDSPTRNRSKLNNLWKTERARVVRKLEDDFRLEEDDDEEEPLTPAEALISAQDYLSRAQKSRKCKSDR